MDKDEDEKNSSRGEYNALVLDDTCTVDDSEEVGGLRPSRYRADSTDRGMKELVCGIGPCRPRWLQWIAGGPKAFALWSTLYMMCKVAENLYVGGVMNAVEKQFGLSSTESGAIIILNDVMDLALVIFVTYFGQKGNRPRIIAAGMLVAGLGLVVCGLPHFVLSPYYFTQIPEGCNQTDPRIDYCTAGETSNGDPCSIKDTEHRPVVKPIAFLIMGQILLGIGNVAVKPLCTTYIDDAVGKHTMAVYVAFFFLAGSLGAILGLVLASVCLSFYVDFDRVPPEDRPEIPRTDPRYIGAWWLGFVVLGCLVMLISIPMFFFPRHLPKTAERLKEERKLEMEAREEGALQMNVFSSEKGEPCSKSDVDKNEVETYNPNRSTFWKVLKEMFHNYKKMLKNVALIIVCLASATEAANIAGNGTFGPKFNREELELTDSLAATLSVATIPFMLAGTVVGGVLIRRRKWSPAKCALLLCFGEFMGVVMAPAFLSLGCETKAIAGISTDYASSASSDATLQMISLPGSAQQAQSPCNMNCTCWDLDYNPVCGADGITYVSPCYAGCEVVDSSPEEERRKPKTFSECRCISGPDGGNSTAVDGICPRDCPGWQIPAVMVANIIQFFCNALGTSGMVVITLRIVDEDMRASALGFQTLVFNLIGFFPAPVYFGRVVNTACILWGYDESERGACWVYDHETYRHAFMGLVSAIRLLTAFLFAWVYLLLRTRKGAYNVQPDKNNEPIA